jgi:hypothetical protein
LLAHGRWFSSGTPASSTTKTGRHDIPVAEILLKVALNTKNHKIKSFSTAVEDLGKKTLKIIFFFHSFRRKLQLENNTMLAYCNQNLFFVRY